MYIFKLFLADATFEIVLHIILYMREQNFHVWICASLVCVQKKNFHLENVVALNFEKLFFFSTTHFLQFLGTFFSFKQECISLIENQIKIICKSNNVRATHYGNSFWVPLKVSRITAIKVYASVLYRITIFFGGYV